MTSLKDYLIIANGPFLDKNIIQESLKNKIIVALDGAVNQLQKYKIKPQIILGDFDSINTASKQYWGIVDYSTQDVYLGQHNVLIVKALDQNKTDLIKAINYCDANGAQSISIICATGGREDHTEGTKLALRSEYHQKRPIIVHTAYQSLRYARDETIQIHGAHNDYCGFIGINGGHGTSNGLKYECIKHSESICNQLIHLTATLTITGDALIILPPQLKSQKK